LLPQKELSMPKNYSENYYRDKLVALSPSVDNLRLMVGAARQAFNRSSLAELEEINRLQDILTLDLDEFFEEVELVQAEKANADNPYLKKLYGLLGHLEHMADEIKKMSEPIQRKIKESTLIADQDYFHVNDLFTHAKGLLRGLADLFHAENKALKQYLRGDANQLLETCFKAETEHETIMSHSFGHPHAFAIYLEILQRFKLMLNHLINLIKVMDEKA
jgi:Na+/phosphate symporter